MLKMQARACLRSIYKLNTLLSTNAHSSAISFVYDLPNFCTFFSDLSSIFADDAVLSIVADEVVEQQKLPRNLNRHNKILCSSKKLHAVAKKTASISEKKSNCSYTECLNRPTAKFWNQFRLVPRCNTRR